MPPRRSSKRDAEAAEAEEVSDAKKVAATPTPNPDAAAVKPAAAGGAVKHFTKDGVKLTLPEGWQSLEDSVLLYEHLAPTASAKIASFDFDGCLVNSKLGNDPNAWSLRYADVISRLTELRGDGFKLVIFTNESTDRLKSPDALQKTVDKKTGRLVGFANQVGLPIQIFVMMRKDKFRKPDTGVWHLMADHHNDGIAVTKEECFFVGDAAGRPRDHSDCDKMFAVNAGLKFFTDDQFFKVKPPKAPKK